MVRDTEIAASLLSPARFQFLQAPIWNGRPCIKIQPVCFAELLKADGWAEYNGLAGLVMGWLAIFKLWPPDLLIADFAPTALLTARTIGIRAYSVGTGWTIPPHLSPAPAFIPASIERVRASEREVLTNANLILKQLNAEPLKRIADLFKVGAITTFSELDYYNVQRRDIIYAGQISALSTAAATDEFSSDKTKVFVYLRNDYLYLDDLLNALNNLDGYEFICCIPNYSGSQYYNLRIHSVPLKLDKILKSADLVISHGGNNLTSEALLAGVPLLVIPQQLEQLVLARRLANRKLISVMSTNIGLSIVEALSLRDNAKSFAEKYENHTTQNSLQNILIGAFHLSEA